MFRSAVFRSVALSARPATVLRPIAAARRPATVAAPSWATGLRYYASGSGLGKEDVENRIQALLRAFDKVTDPSNVKPNSHFANDLGLDSLDTVEVVMAIEEEFSIEIPDKEADAIHSVDKAVDYILSQPDAN